MINNNELQYKLQKTTLIASEKNDYSFDEGLKASVEKEGVSKVSGDSVAQAKLPPEVVSMKLDLFDNSTDEQALQDIRKFKLACNFIMKDQSRVSWNSSLNGRASDYKYNSIDQRGEHFKTAWSLYQEFKYQTEGLKISKFYESGKKNTVEQASVVFYQKAFSYMVYLVFGTNIIEVELMNKNISPRARAQGVVANSVISAGNQSKTNAVELLWGKKKHG